MCGGSCEVVFRDALRVSGAGVRAASIPVFPVLQVGYREGLCAKARCQVFEGRDVLIHDLLGAQPPLINGVLLEGPHKVCKHPLDPESGQDIAFGNEFGERPWNAALEAEKRRDMSMLPGSSVRLD